MFPVLLSIGPITVYSYGVLLFLGFLFGLFIIWHRSREEHFDEEQVLDSLIAIAFVSLICARVTYVALHLSTFGFNPLAWFNLIGKPGFTLFGALIGGYLAAKYQTKKRKWNFFEYVDILVIGVSLTYVFGWLGSFLNGSNLGLVTESFVGLAFQGVYDHRHPVQLYNLILYLGLFSYLWWVEGKYRTFDWYSGGKAGAKEGFLFFNFLGLSGLIGLLISPFSEPSLTLFNINIDSLLNAVLLFIGLIGLYIRSGREFGKDFRQLGTSKERVSRQRAKDRRHLRRHLGRGTDILK